MDIRIALSPILLSCWNMRTPPSTAADDACHRRGNDGKSASFRARDNARPSNPLPAVKSLFNLLNFRQED
jgi:hypothetical protein